MVGPKHVASDSGVSKSKKEGHLLTMAQKQDITARLENEEWPGDICIAMKNCAKNSFATR
jgi:hypothetical protein